MEIENIRFHTRKHLSEIVKDHSFLYGGICIYVFNWWGHKFGIKCIPIEARPSEDEILVLDGDIYLIYKKDENLEKKELVKTIPIKEEYCRSFNYCDLGGKENSSSAYLRHMAEKGLSPEKIEDQCTVEAEMVEIARNQNEVKQIDLSRLSEGIVNSDKGILTLDNYQGGERIFDEISFHQTICGFDCKISISEKDWYSGYKENFLQISISESNGWNSLMKILEYYNIHLKSERNEGGYYKKINDHCSVALPYYNDHGIVTSGFLTINLYF